MIPRIDAQEVLNPDHPNHAAAMEAVKVGASDVGFLTVYNGPISAADVAQVIDAYYRFFMLPAEEKEQVNMAKTKSNRGWGGPQSEQVDPDANPDYKQVFDCGFQLPADDPLRGENLSYYAPNQWPKKPDDFFPVIRDYYDQACAFSLQLLKVIATAIGEDAAFFDDKFDRPMALLRGNYYPERPSWAGVNDFGIATHTDYGCLTLLATDGTPGLEVRKRGGGWIPVTAPVGEFVINFGEMIEFWTQGRVKATPHRVVGGSDERLSVPLFFNPNHDTNVVPVGSADVIKAGDHMEKRFSETYVHLKG
jgi:isopenicillin N synthase-like dioxygenase